MDELNAAHLSFLKHLSDGGIASLRSYGKRVRTLEIVCKPRSNGAGLKSLNHLLDLGVVRYGDVTPFKSGTSTAIVLTDAGKLEIGVE